MGFLVLQKKRLVTDTENAEESPEAWIWEDTEMDSFNCLFFCVYACSMFAWSLSKEMESTDKETAWKDIPDLCKLLSITNQTKPCA